MKTFNHSCLFVLLKEYLRSITKLKNCLLLSVIGMLFLCSCSSPTCPEIESIIGKGNTVNISLFECGTFEKVFDVSFSIILEDRSNNENDDNNYIYPIVENIQFKKYEDFDYKLKIVRNSISEFTVYIRLIEGDEATIEFDNLVYSKPPKDVSYSPSPGWRIGFSFDIDIVERNEESNQMEIAIRPGSSDAALEIFGRNAYFFEKKHSLEVSVTE